MIVVCQKCTKRYHLEPVSLGEKGRKVRCASCGHIWFQEAEPVSPAFSLEEKPLTPTPSEPSFFHRFARLFIKILLVFCLMGAGLLAFSLLGVKQWISRHVPQLELLFGMGDMSATEAQNGLEIRQIHVDPVGGLWGGAHEDGKKPSHYSFMIKGQVVNTSSQLQILPPLKIQLKGKCPSPQKGPDCILEEWTHALSKTQILPGEVIQFEISLEHGQSPGSSFFVSFK